MRAVGLDALTKFLTKGRFRIVAVVEMKFDFSPSRSTEFGEMGELPFIVLVPWIEEAVRRRETIVIAVPCRNERVLSQPLFKPSPRDVPLGPMDLRLEVIGDREEQMNRALCSRAGCRLNALSRRAKSNVERVNAIAPSHALYALTMKCGA